MGTSIWKNSSLIAGNRAAMDFRRIADCLGGASNCEWQRSS